jgi:hypothetical protein
VGVIARSSCVMRIGYPILQVHAAGHVGWK